MGLLFLSQTISSPPLPSLPSPPLFFPSLGTLPVLDGAIQTGRGVAAGVIGQTYDVRCLLQPNPATGSISSQVAIYTSYPARLRRITKKISIEDDIFSLVCFEATCDNRIFFDINSNGTQTIEMTETGYESGVSGIYSFAQARPTRETLWMRTEANVAITRMSPTAGLASQQPVSGWVAANEGTYGGIQKDTEAVLTLNSGVYSFSSSGASPASVQCGLQPLNRIKDTSSSVAAGKWPTALYREMFLAYIPLIPGEQLSELDRLNFPNSDRYEIAVIYTSEQTGIQGYITVVEKLST